MSETPKVRIAIRGFLGRTRLFEDRMEVDEDDIDGLLVRQMGENHAEAMANGTLTMVEIEFLDMPIEERFFRIGTDPSGMVIPIQIL